MGTILKPNNCFQFLNFILAKYKTTYWWLSSDLAKYSQLYHSKFSPQACVNNWVILHLLWYSSLTPVKHLCNFDAYDFACRPCKTFKQRIYLNCMGSYCCMHGYYPYNKVPVRYYINTWWSLTKRSVKCISEHF